MSLLIIISSAFSPSISRIEIPTTGFDAAVEMQPAGDPLFVSIKENTASLSPIMLEKGGAAVFIHNWNGGWRLYDVKVGDRIIVHYGLWAHISYRVTAVYRYQYLNGQYKDLATGIVQDEKTVIDRVFLRDYLTIQTCLDGGDSLEWGRLFVQAKLDS